MAQTTNYETMTRAERFMSVWIENNGYQYDNFPVGECMQSYADHQLKAKMPSDEDIADWININVVTKMEGNSNLGMPVNYSQLDVYHILRDYKEWLKQQILKP